MIRLFEQHVVREQKELDGIWQYVKADGEVYALPVPGCVEQHPALVNYRGKGAFYKRIFVREAGNIRLEFKGVSHTADVYFDGALVAHHYNAYTGFEAVITEVAKGEHEIKVCVDNSFNEASALHVPNDYYTYGGIIRPVVQERLADIYIKRMHFTPRKAVDGWHGEVELEIENIGKNDASVEVQVDLTEAHTAASPQAASVHLTQDIPVAQYSAASSLLHIAAQESTKITLIVDCDNVVEWDVLSPNLYFVRAQLWAGEQVLDDYIDRVGFREVSMAGRRLLLNGHPVFLKGFNRHEDYGTIGNAVPLQIMAQDMDLMREAGANAVRTCHYPNDERFLDLCDERGMLVWEENHARGFNLERMCNPNFDRQCADCIDEMISQHYNHPSIVIWGILNECDSTSEEGRKKYKSQYEQIKRLDATRPTTSATCKHFQDICLDLPDLVSFNIYSGWYEDIGVQERHEQEMDWIAQTGGAGKPVIVSEFGGGAIYGYRDRTHCKWSEERQADIIRENLEVYRADDRISGVFIWQFADCRVTEEEWAFSRPKCHNNKGIVDEYRRPKEAFDVVKELFPTMNAPKQENI